MPFKMFYCIEIANLRPHQIVLLNVVLQNQALCSYTKEGLKRYTHNGYYVYFLLWVNLAINDYDYYNDLYLYPTTPIAPISIHPVMLCMNEHILFGHWYTISITA